MSCKRASVKKFGYFALTMGFLILVVYLIMWGVVRREKAHAARVREDIRRQEELHERYVESFLSLEFRRAECKSLFQEKDRRDFPALSSEEEASYRGEIERGEVSGDWARVALGIRYAYGLGLPKNRLRARMYLEYLTRCFGELGSWANLVLGDLCRLAQDTEGAKAHYERAIAMVGGCGTAGAQAHLQLGDLYRVEKNIECAKHHYKAAIAMDPDDAGLRLKANYALITYFFEENRERDRKKLLTLLSSENLRRIQNETSQREASSPESTCLSEER